MKTASWLVLILLIVFLASCGPALPPIPILHAITPTPTQIVSASLDSTFVRVSSHTSQSGAATPTPEPILMAVPDTGSSRPAFEEFSFVFKTSRFGIPYDEAYNFQFDTSTWGTLRIYDEGSWMVQEIQTLSEPACAIQSRVSTDDSLDAATLKALDSRYRRMGTYTTGDLSFDVFSFTSDAQALADTQNVVYILTAANGDHPYLVKPQFRAFSAYDDWEACRALVRSALSTLVMKRVPVE